MSKFEWSIYNVTQDYLIGEFTQLMTFSWGRDSPITPYQGRTATITMLNDADQSQYVSNADQIHIILSTSISKDWLSKLEMNAENMTKSCC